MANEQLIYGRIVNGVKYDYSLSDDQVVSVRERMFPEGTPSGSGLDAHKLFLLKHLDYSDKGNIQLDAKGEYSYKAANPAKKYGETVNSAKGTIVTWEELTAEGKNPDGTWTTAVANRLAYYEAEEAKMQYVAAVDGAAKYDGTTVNKDTTIAKADLTEAEIAFYSDITRGYYEAAVSGAAKPDGTTVNKKTIVSAIGMSNEDKLFYDTLVEAGDWSYKTYWKEKATTWSRDYSNVSLEADASIKLRGTDLVVENEADLVNTRMESVGVNAEKLKLNAGVVSIKHNVTKNSEEKGSDIMLLYDFTNNLTDSNVDLATAINNYKLKKLENIGSTDLSDWGTSVPGYKTDAEITAMYNALKNLPRKRHTAHISDVIAAGEAVAKGVNGKVLGMVDGQLVWVNAPAGSGSADYFASDFKVNGVVKTPSNGVVALTAGGSYTLEGTLNGRVEIGVATDETGADTEVILKNVKIVNDWVDSSSNNSYGIAYLPQKKTLAVTLAPNSYNEISCGVAPVSSADRANYKAGALYSEQNMDIRGEGYLNLINKAGHGVKAHDLSMYGMPHIYVEAYHDAFHGTTKTLIYDGFYHIEKANDAFGSRAAEGTPESADYKAPGFIDVYDGEFEAFNLEGNVFDSKGAGRIFCTLRLKTNVATGDILSGMTQIDPKIYFGGGSVNEGVYSNVTGEVYSGSFADGGFSVNKITKGEDGAYDCGTGSVILITGYVEGEIQSTCTAGVDVYLANAYVMNPNGHVINFMGGDKKVCIRIPKAETSYTVTPASQNDWTQFTINPKNDIYVGYLISKGMQTIITSGDDESDVETYEPACAVLSDNNAAFEVKKNGYLFISSETGDGVSADIITCADSSGVIRIDGCGRYGFDAKDIRIGELDNDGVTINPFEGGLVVTNSKSSDFFAKINKKNRYGTITMSADYLTGVVVINGFSCGRYLGKANGLSSDGKTYNVIALDTEHLYYKKVNGGSLIGTLKATKTPCDYMTEPKF